MKQLKTDNIKRCSINGLAIDRKTNFRFIEVKVIDKYLCKHEPPYVIEDLLEMELCRMKKRESQ